MTFQSMLSVDPATALRLAAALMLFGVIPGAALVRLLFRRPSLLQYAVYGVVFGLSLWAVGGMLSHLVGIVPLRWVPVIAVMALWLVRRPARTPIPARRRPVPAHAVAGALLAMVALLPSLRAALASQPADWSGWQLFHNDLPFHVALAGEAAVRAPEQLPWVAGTDLSYTWLFHSAMGVWAAGAGASAAEVVLQAWPVLFILVFPVLLAMVAAELTRERWVAFAAPLVFVLAHGPLATIGTIEQVPVFQVSPTRDFASVVTMVAILSLVRVLGRGGLRALSPWWLVALAVTTFAAAGSKGSALPLLLAGSAVAGLVLIARRRWRRSDLLVAGVVVVAGSVALLLALPSPGVNEALAFGPLSFLPAETPGRSAVAVVIALLLLATVVGVGAALRAVRPRLAPALFFGILIAGVAGLTLLTHPGGSQAYFWQSAQPVLAIALSWTGVVMLRRHGRRLAAVLLVIVLATTAMWIASLSILATTAVTVVLAAAGTLVLSRRSPGRTGALGIVALAALSVQGGQLVSVPAGTSGGGPDDGSHPAAIHASQLAAFLFLRDNAGVDDIVATNKHCYNGSEAAGDCDGLWFALTAWSERRVFVDGWKYTPHGADRSWVAERVDLSDGFIAHPSAAGLRALQAAGVSWLYVDLRQPHSADLGDFADLRFEGEFADVYRLD